MQLQGAAVVFPAQITDTLVERIYQRSWHDLEESYRMTKFHSNKLTSEERKIHIYARLRDRRMLYSGRKSVYEQNGAGLNWLLHKRSGCELREFKRLAGAISRQKVTIRGPRSETNWPKNRTAAMFTPLATLSQHRSSK